MVLRAHSEFSLRFSVHPNSMNNTNHFISGDNKGAASLMMEKV